MSTLVDIEAARLAVSQAIARVNRALDELGDLDAAGDVLDGEACVSLRTGRGALREATRRLQAQYDGLKGAT